MRLSLRAEAGVQQVAGAHLRTCRYFLQLLTYANPSGLYSSLSAVILKQNCFGILGRKCRNFHAGRSRLNLEFALVRKKAWFKKLA
jgi:hypothetical protein